MNLTEITLTSEEEFGALCIANERNERDRKQYERSLAESNNVAGEAYRVAERAAEEAHRESERVAFDAHDIDGDDPFVPTEYVPDDPFTPDDTPFSPRDTEELVTVAVREMLTQCAERAHQQEVADIGRSVMSLDHAARITAIDAMAD